MPVTREKLYEEVWAEPMTTVATRYDVSSSFLARVCERLNVPRPPRGYWAQLAVGKADEQPALPAARPGEELEWARQGEVAPPKRTPSWEPVPTGRKRTGERPELHPLVDGVKPVFEKSRPPGYFDVTYLRPFKHMLVDILVSKESLDRALDAANEIFLALEDRGHHVVLAPHGSEFGRPAVDEREVPNGERYNHRSWGPSRPTVVYIDGLALGLTLFELSENVEVRRVGDSYVRVSQSTAPKRGYDYTLTKDMPTGRLCLRATSPYRLASWEHVWREAKPGDLVAKLPKLVRELEKGANELPALLQEGQRQADEREAKWKVQQEKWRIEEQERRRKEAEELQEKQVRDDVERWRLARDIREYIAGLRKLVADADLRFNEEGSLARYVNAADALADRVDPLRGLKDEIAQFLEKQKQANSTTSENTPPDEEETP